MKKVNIHFISFILYIIVVSCSASLDDDARKAAELTMISTQNILDKELDEAEKVYAEVEKIISKYVESGRAEEFYKAYEAYLHQSEF